MGLIGVINVQYTKSPVILGNSILDSILPLNVGKNVHFLELPEITGIGRF